MASFYLVAGLVLTWPLARNFRSHLPAVGVLFDPLLHVFLLDYLRVSRENNLALLVPPLGARCAGFFPGLMAMILAAVALPAVCRGQAGSQFSSRWPLRCWRV